MLGLGTALKILFSVDGENHLHQQVCCSFRFYLLPLCNIPCCKVEFVCLVSPWSSESIVRHVVFIQPKYPAHDALVCQLATLFLKCFVIINCRNSILFSMQTRQIYEVYSDMRAKTHASLIVFRPNLSFEFINDLSNKLLLGHYSVPVAAKRGHCTRKSSE